MPKRISLAASFVTFLLMFAGFLALGSVRQYGLGLLVIPLVLFPLAPVGTYLEDHSALWRWLRKVAVILYICFLPISLQILGLMDAVITLVIFIQAYLWLGKKSGQAYYQLFLMSFFLLLAALVQDPESLVALALLIYGVSAVWAFATIRVYVEMTQSPQKRLPEILPVGSRQIVPGQAKAFDLGLLVSLITLSVVTVALTTIVFIFTPRVEAGWLGRREVRPTVTGLSETVRLGAETRIYEDTSVVLYVQFPDEPEGIFSPAELLYWRVTTLPRFSQNEWSRRGLQEHYVPGIRSALRRASRRDLREVGRAQRSDAREVRQIIYVDNVPAQGIPCLDLPIGIRILSESSYARVGWDSTEDFTFAYESRGARNVQYEAFSDIVLFPEERLRRAVADYGFVSSRDLSLLTYHELLPETVAFVRTLTDDQPTLYDKVKTLERWLSGPDFTYTLDIPPLPEQNSMDAFLMNTRRGHCQLFASALALMVRSLGIPARLVSGYRGGEYVAADQAYLVRSSMAHLWVEVLFNDLGWVRFDPSPQPEMTPTGFERARMAWSSLVLRGKLFWYQRVIGFQGNLRLEQILGLRPRSRRVQSPAPHVSENSDAEQTQDNILFWSVLHYRYFYGIPAAACLIGFLFFLYRKRRLGNGLRNLSRDQRRIRKLYLQFLGRASRLGVDCTNKSASEIWDTLKTLPLKDKDAVRNFLMTYHAVRFGGFPLPKERESLAKSQLASMKYS